MDMRCEMKNNTMACQSCTGMKTTLGKIGESIKNMLLLIE